LALVRAKEASKRNKAHQKDKRELRKNDRSFQLKKAQTSFNRYIRARDFGMPCISCGNPNPKKKNAGHYKTTAAYPELRFCDRQVHLQCEPCNSHKSGNIIEYRKGLIDRVGIGIVNWIEGPHELTKYTIDDLVEINKKYTALYKEVELANNCM
jgi:hypothetical protein